MSSPCAILIIDCQGSNLSCSTKFKEKNPLCTSLGGAKQVEVTAFVSLAGVCENSFRHEHVYLLTFSCQVLNGQYCLGIKTIFTLASLHLEFFACNCPTTTTPLHTTYSFIFLSCQLKNHFFRKASPVIPYNSLS